MEMKACTTCKKPVASAASICLRCGSKVQVYERVSKDQTHFSNVMNTSSFVVPTGRRVILIWIIVTILAIILPIVLKKLLKH